VIADRAAAIHRALGMATAGDTVLVAGKGHEDFQMVGDERRPFDDREVARRWLYNLSSPLGASWLDGMRMTVRNS
jgi:UDP-N-acetylmuramoyl-L-alanyl-D-glutamate--2,6-diaminopimelate ligase